MKGLLYSLTAAGFLFLLFAAASCATGTGVPGEDVRSGKKVSRTSADERGRRHVPLTYSLGVSPRRYFLYEKLDVQMMYEAQSAELVRSLGLEEKIGQLFIISLWNGAENEYSLKLGEWEKKQLDFIRPGGVILFGGNIDTEKQVQTLCSGLQKYSDIPLFIAADQEGGYIGRLYESGKIPATRIPPPAKIGSTGNADYAYLAGWITGRETSAAGLNIIFAPVADVHNRATHPVIGSRSFGAEPERVAEMSSAFAEGVYSGGVLPVMKHFPGHGGADADPHFGSTVDPRSLQELRESDLLPFIKGINAGIDCIMVSHVIMPNIGGDDLPASCSPFINTELLRNRLGFRGIAVSDSISMGAITSRWEEKEAVLAVLNSGADCILEPPSPLQAFTSLLKAVQEGTVSERRVDTSLRRIFTVKLKAGIIPWQPEWGPDPRKFVSNKPENSTLLEKYIPGWRGLENSGIGNILHKKINSVITEAVRRSAEGNIK